MHVRTCPIKILACTYWIGGSMHKKNQRRKSMIGKVTTAVCYTALGITWFNLCLLCKEDLGLMVL